MITMVIEMYSVAVFVRENRTHLATVHSCMVAKRYPIPNAPVAMVRDARGSPRQPSLVEEIAELEEREQVTKVLQE